MTPWSPMARERELTRQIRQALQAELGVAAGAVSDDATFVDLGLDSTGVMVIAGDLSDLLGRTVTPETFFEHPSPRLLARHLAGSRARPRRDGSGQ